MRRLATLLMGAAALVTGLSLAAPKEANALLLSNTAKSAAGLIGASVAGPLTSYYDLAPAGVVPPGDGAVTSEVFAGVGAAAGLFAYAYQISPTVLSAAPISGLAFNWQGVASSVGGDTSAYDSTGGTFPAPFVLGGTAPVGVDLTGGVLDISFFGAKIPAGGDNYVVYLFSPLPPGIVGSNIKDGTVTVTDALVYSPVPIPGAVWLFGTGVLGLLGIGYTRRRQAAA